MNHMNSSVLDNPKNRVLWLVSKNDVHRIKMYRINKIRLIDDIWIYRTPFAKNGADNTAIQYELYFKFPHGRFDVYRCKTIDEVRTIAYRLIDGESIYSILKGKI